MRTAFLSAPLGVLMVVAPLVFAESARPCSQIPSLDGTATPDDGALLPTNGIVHARLDSVGLPMRASVRADHEVSARALDIDDVAGVTRINLDGLAPSTSYTLTLMLPEASPDDGVRTSRAIHFTTTRAADTTAPSFSGTADVVVTRIDALDAFVPSCGFGSVAGNAVNIFPPAVADDADDADDAGIAGIQLVRVNDDGTRTLRAFHLRSGDAGDGEIEGALVDTVVDTEPTPGDYRYELVAVDLAGNESAPFPVDVTVPEATFGCSAAGPTSSLALGLLLLLAGARRARMRT